MKRKTLPVILLMLLLVSNSVKAQNRSYEYSYAPPLQTYTECGSGTMDGWKMDYNRCYLAGGLDEYSYESIKCALWSRNASTGTLTFRVKKCSGYFVNGNSGKIFILDNSYGDVYCTNFSITNSTTSYVTAQVPDYGDFSGTRTFWIYLITYDQLNKQYAGEISITGSEEQLPPTVQTLSATNVTANSARLRATVNPNGDETTYRFRYGTSASSLPNYTTPQTLDGDEGNTSVYANISNLEPNTTYWFRAFAANGGGLTNGTTVSFTTESDGESPVAYNCTSTNITATSATLNGKINPGGLVTTYHFEYGTSTNYGNSTVTGTLPASNSAYNVSANIDGLQPNTTYYFGLFAENDKGIAIAQYYTFTTDQSNCYFPDCSSASHCGNSGYSGQIYTASQYLCDLGIVEGIDGYLEPDSYVTRAELAKMSLFSLYSNSTGVHLPSHLVTDYFPCIYPDLQENTFYYQAAKALLYLEYGDGIAPFDRDRGCFYPADHIERCLVLKVLLETFNIEPANSGYNPFSDFPTSHNAWGYAKKAYDLDIVQTTEFRPLDYCTRGEVMLYLYRILTNPSITKPTPNNTESPLTSDFFIPANLSPEVVNSIRGVEYGNFNYYEKDFFNIPGYMDLNFGISYNSYLTEMPNDFYPVEPLGKAWTHTYDLYMNIVSDDYSGLSVLVFHMHQGTLLMYANVNGELSSLTEGNYYDLTKASNDKYILKATTQIAYTFERFDSGNIFYLTHVEDRHNNTIDILYSSANNQYRINTVTTLGRTLHFYYRVGSNRIYYVKDPINRTVYFNYDADGQLTSLEDAKDQTTSFSYGTLAFEKGLLKEITLPRGNKVYNNYEQRKLVSMSRINSSGSTHTDIAISPNYQNGSYSSSVTENQGNGQSFTTNYTMNINNRITNVNDGFHTNVSYQYDIPGDHNLVSKMIDNNTNIQTTFGYTPNGYLAQATYSSAGETHTVQYTYTDLNDIHTFTDARGNTTTYNYDNDGKMTDIVDALGNTTSFTYNSHGKPTRVTDPMGVSINYGYNNYGNPTSVTIPSLNISNTTVYDDISRTISNTDFAGHTTTFTYDNNDNILSTTDDCSHTTSYMFDANDNVIQITNAKGYSTNFSYDNNDFLVSESFLGATKSYTYNRNGTINSFTNPNGFTFNYSYDNAGELISDGTSTISYDSKGRIVSVTKDGKSISYTYDNFGRISSISYDGQTIGYTYDNNDNVSSITYPGNKTVTYTYDALNRMTSVKDWNNATTTYTYRNDGQFNYYQYPNNVRTTYNFDNSGRCIGISTKRNSGNGSVIAEYGFGLDAIGNHTSESFTEPFDTYPSIPSENISYSYNNANRLLTAGNLSFTYDGNGNTLSRSGRTYDYDEFNQITNVSGDFSASYSYDALGNRHSATRNGVTTNYVLNLLGSTSSVLMETAANGTVQNYYIYGASGLVSRIDANNNTRYYVYDYRGSTVAMTDASTSANITHKYQYDDFGKLLQVEEETPNSYRYVGRYGVMYEDDALTFMRARYYDPEIGRFLSEDPIWSTNLYPYADNNPIMGVDPKGELVIAAGIFLGACAMISAASGIIYLVGNIIDYGHPLPDPVTDNLTVKDYIDYGVTFFGGVLPDGGSKMAAMIENGIIAGYAVTDSSIGWIKGTKKLSSQKKAKKSDNNAPAVASNPTEKTCYIDSEAFECFMTSDDPKLQQMRSVYYYYALNNSIPRDKSRKICSTLIRMACEQGLIK